MKKTLFSLVAAATVFVSAASATITVINPTVTGSGPYQWNYTINGDTSEQLVSGQTYFVIYDFQGYVSNSIAAPSNWTASTSLNAAIPPGLILPNNPSVTDLIFTYNGPTVTSPGAQTTGFSAWSTYGVANLNGLFAYNAEKIANPTAPDVGSGPVSVPSAAPEPMTMSLIGGGLALLGLARFRRK